MKFNTKETHALMEITARPELVFVSGRGGWLQDGGGKSYLDFVQGWAVNCLGHAPQIVQKALAEQAQQLINPSPAFFNLPSMKLAQMLVAHSVFDRVFFCNTGAEANEGAIKLARKWGAKHRAGAHEIITFVNGFHGRTLATMAASGKAGWDQLFSPKVPGFPKAIYNDLASVEALIGPQTVAVMLEPVQGEAGVIPATPEFLHGLRRLTQEYGILLIVDEVQTGMGRCGTLFYHEQAGIEPDIMSLAKGIGAGVPLAALLAKESVCCFEHGDQGGTYNGNPLMTAVGLAVLEQLLAPGFLESVRARASQLSDGLLSLAQRHGLPGERGVGLLRALVLSDASGSSIVKRARELEPEGLLLNSPRGNLLRFMPALNVTAAEIDKMLEMLDGLLSKR